MEKEVTQVEFESLKSEISNYFQELNRKMDRLLDPESGVFAKIQNLDAKSDKAHERLDAFGDSYAKVKDIIYGNGVPGIREQIRDLTHHRDRTVKVLVRIGWTISTPILGGLGYLLWSILIKT